MIAGAKQAAYKNNNTILPNMYWQIGKLIVEDEQKGRSKAVYGKATLKNFASELREHLEKDLMSGT